MIDYLIHEIAVVTDYYHAPWEVLQVFLQYLKGDDVEIVGGLVQYQEVRVLHQYGTKIELTALATTQLIYIIILLIIGKEEILQQLRCRQLAPTAKVNIFCNITNDIDNFLLIIELQSFLREIAEANGIANDDMSIVDRHQS